MTEKEFKIGDIVTDGVIEYRVIQVINHQKVCYGTTSHSSPGTKYVLSFDNIKLI